MSEFFTHGTIEDADRVWRNCLCAQCGTVGVHMPGNEFNPIEDAGGPLLCPECHDGAMWDGVEGDPWAEYHRREAEHMRRRDWQPDVANNATAQLLNASELLNVAAQRNNLHAYGIHVAAEMRISTLIGRSFGEQR